MRSHCQRSLSEFDIFSLSWIRLIHHFNYLIIPPMHDIESFQHISIVLPRLFQLGCHVHKWMWHSQISILDQCLLERMLVWKKNRPFEGYFRASFMDFPPIGFAFISHRIAFCSYQECLTKAREIGSIQGLHPISRYWGPHDFLVCLEEAITKKAHSFPIEHSTISKLREGREWGVAWLLICWEIGCDRYRKYC